MRRGLFAAVFISSAVACAGGGTMTHRCSSAEDPFGCLLTDPKGFYSSDYSAFFDVLNAESAIALQCDPTSSATRILRLHSLLPGNAEVSEALHETTETLLATNPTCLLEATQSFTAAEASALASALRRPLFSSAEEVSAAMGKLRGSSGGHPVVRSYFNR